MPNPKQVKQEASNVDIDHNQQEASPIEKLVPIQVHTYMYMVKIDNISFFYETLLVCDDNHQPEELIKKAVPEGRKYTVLSHNTSVQEVTKDVALKYAGNNIANVRLIKIVDLSTEQEITVQYSY